MEGLVGDDVLTTDVFGPVLMEEELEDEFDDTETLEILPGG